MARVVASKHKLTNEAVNPLKLRQIIFWQVAKAVNMLKTG
jgi:hypothetical protein